MHAPDAPHNRHIVPECKENVGLRERHMKEQMWSTTDLLESISEFEQIKRIRYMTSHPNDMSDSLIY